MQVGSPPVTSAAILAGLVNQSVSANNYTASASGWIGQNGRSLFRAPSPGEFALRDWAETMSASLVVEGNNVLAQRGGISAQMSRIYATYTDASNFERLNIGFFGGRYVIQGERAGSGSNRGLWLSSDGSSIFGIEDNYLSTGAAFAARRDGTSGITQFVVGGTGLTSTAILHTRLMPTINQASGTYVVLDINPTEAGVGAGPHYLIQGRIGAGSNVFSVDRVGSVLLGNTTAGITLKNNGGAEVQVLRGDGATLAGVRAFSSRTTGGTLSSIGTPNGQGVGTLTYVNDLTSTTRGATATGGGSLKGLVWSDGTNWLVV